MSVAGAAWTDLAGGVRVRQSRAFAMNSVLLLDRRHTVVVDPGVLPSELDDLARAVDEASPARVTLFFTHAHWDHVLGRPWWPKAKTLAHDRCAEEMRRDPRVFLIGEDVAEAGHPFKTLLGLAWMAGLLLPVGFWGRAWGDRALAAGIVGAALTGTPLVTAVLPSRPSEWLAAAAGLLLGTWLRRIARRASNRALSASAG